MKTLNVHVGELARNDRGAFKIGPFGSALKKSELVASGIPVAGIENVLPNEFIKGFRRFVSPKKFNELSDYEIQPGDVLVTTMGTIGRAAVAPRDIGRTIIDSHLFRMRLETNRVYPQFLCYGLNSEFVVSQLKRMARGAIMEGLNTGILKECLIPLPDLPEQKRIAALLEKADRLRRTRRYASQLSDTFLQSVFLEMFGDVRTRRNRFDETTIGDSLKLKSGEAMTAMNMGRGGKYPVYGGNGISGYHTSYLFAGRTIVIGRVGIYCGVVHYTEPTCWVSDNALYVSEKNPRFDDVFLVHAMMEANLNQYADRSGQPLISQGRLEKVNLFVPPLPLQQKFADVVRRFEHLRAQQREADRQAEHLFQTLLHRAFSEGGI